MKLTTEIMDRIAVLYERSEQLDGYSKEWQHVRDSLEDELYYYLPQLIEAGYMEALRNGREKA